MVAFSVLETKSKAYPHWAVATDSAFDSPWRLLTSFSWSMLWQSGAAWVNYSSWSASWPAVCCWASVYQ